MNFCIDVTGYGGSALKIADSIQTQETANGGEGGATVRDVSADVSVKASARFGVSNAVTPSSYLSSSLSLSNVATESS